MELHFVCLYYIKPICFITNIEPLLFIDVADYIFSVGRQNIIVFPWVGIYMIKREIKALSLSVLVPIFKGIKPIFRSYSWSEVDMPFITVSSTEKWLYLQPRLDTLFRPVIKMSSDMDQHFKTSQTFSLLLYPFCMHYLIIEQHTYFIFVYSYNVPVIFITCFYMHMY